MTYMFILKCALKLVLKKYPTCEEFINFLLYSNISDKCWSVVYTPILLKNVIIIATSVRTSGLVSLIFTA